MGRCPGAAPAPGRPSHPRCAPAPEPNSGRTFRRRPVKASPVPVSAVLSHESADRLVEFAVSGAPDVAPRYLSDTPAAVPPMRPSHMRAAYGSRNGAPWELESVQVLGTYAPADPASPWSDRPASGVWFYPSSPNYPGAEKPRWVAEVVRALGVPAARGSAPAVGFTVTSDLARRTRYFTLAGLDEIPHWFRTSRPVASPMRPDKVRITYLNSGDTAWGWDEIEFEGPYVATGKTPAPGQNRERTSYYPTSLRRAPQWVRDFLDAHRVPAPLRERQPH